MFIIYFSDPPELFFVSDSATVIQWNKWNVVYSPMRREYLANKNNLQDQLSSIEKDAKEMGQDKA